uniref:Uncharacterized protein n=1 Tax=Stomoxys calcitrans TaxID=35570 RepID=A0A1I8Q531_STOCA
MSSLRSFKNNFYIFLYLWLLLAKKCVTDPYYTTCDFDLEGIEELLQYLPAICGEIFSKRHVDGQLYESYMDESKTFAQFHRKLDDYELRNKSQSQTVYSFEKELRNDIYGKHDMIDCVQYGEGTATGFLNCVKGKHIEMEHLIPAVINK